MGFLTDMVVTLFSFGFKHNTPEADTVVDVRFLPNPYYVPELSPGTGLEEKVAGYVLNNDVAEKFFAHFIPFLTFFIQSHAQTEKETLRLAVGCTGGRHRSVAVVENIRYILAKNGIEVEIFHRDIDKI